jgi:hypothetical protein
VDRVYSNVGVYFQQGLFVVQELVEIDGIIWVLTLDSDSVVFVYGLPKFGNRDRK